VVTPKASVTATSNSGFCIGAFSPNAATLDCAIDAEKQAQHFTERGAPGAARIAFRTHKKKGPGIKGSDTGPKTPCDR